MEINYAYKGVHYPTEAEAQDAVASTKIRLDNNPTDWCVVKELQDNGNGTFLVLSAELSDSQINNPDTAKKYLCYSIQGSGHAMPLSSSELSQKVVEYRTIYFNHENLGQIIKFEITGDDDENAGTATVITPSVDMSGYV